MSATTAATPVLNALQELRAALGMESVLHTAYEGPSSSDSYTLRIEFHEPDYIAARTLKPILDQLYEDVALKAFGPVENKEADEEEGRQMKLLMPSREAHFFVTRLRQLTEAVRTHPKLAAQYKDARQLIGASIDRDRIVGAYPSIRLALEKGQERFDLHMVAPLKLARALAGHMKCEVDDFPDSKPSPNHSYTRLYTGGKDVIIPMNHPNIAAIRAEIFNYPERVAGSHDPEAHLTPGRSMGQAAGRGNGRGGR